MDEEDVISANKRSVDGRTVRSLLRSCSLIMVLLRFTTDVLYASILGGVSCACLHVVVHVWDATY